MIKNLKSEAKDKKVSVVFIGFVTFEDQLCRPVMICSPSKCRFKTAARFR